MKVFSGFPAGKVRTIALPEPLFTELIPLIDDLAELKLTLHILQRLGQQRGGLRYICKADLITDEALLTSLSHLGDAPHVTLQDALTRAVERGSLLRAREPHAGGDELYFANTPRGRAAVEAIERGEWPAELESARRPTIFTLYEQNIGLLTPLITDELRAAENEYPAEWIEQAFREAVALNKRSWKYIRAILERWRTEGKAHAASRRPRDADRRRYIEGEYGEYIEH
jgi:DnaD/phage-associated family protein